MAGEGTTGDRRQLSSGIFIQKVILSLSQHQGREGCVCVCVCLSVHVYGHEAASWPGPPCLKTRA